MICSVHGSVHLSPLTWKFDILCIKVKTRGVTYIYVVFYIIKSGEMILLLERFTVMARVVLWCSVMIPGALLWTVVILTYAILWLVFT